MHHDDASAAELLDALELRLTRPAVACFEVTPDAPIGAVSEAFLTLAHTVHPRSFAATNEATKQRAARCFRDLRAAYWSIVMQRSTVEAPASNAREIAFNETAMTRRLRRS